VGCYRAVQRTISELPETWVALHAAIGDRTVRPGQKVSGSRAAPINLNTDVDQIKGLITEWLTCAAARVAEKLGADDPQPRSSADSEHARIVVACCRLIGPNLDKLLESEPEDVLVWLSGRDTKYPGERVYVDGQGVTHQGVRVLLKSGIDIALELVRLQRQARTLLGVTTPRYRLALPCPHCSALTLTRRHDANHDEVSCDSCNKMWTHDHYRRLCLLFLDDQEDEMRLEEVQKQLEEWKVRSWLTAEQLFTEAQDAEKRAAEAEERRQSTLTLIQRVLSATEDPRVAAMRADAFVTEIRTRLQEAS
jgi:hypothetical protein